MRVVSQRGKAGSVRARLTMATVSVLLVFLANEPGAKLTAAKLKAEVQRTESEARAVIAENFTGPRDRKVSSYSAVGSVKNTVLLTAGLHGNEVEGMLFLSWLEARLERKSGAIYAAMKRYRFQVVAANGVNAAGVRANTRVNSNKVDLNRNFRWLWTSRESTEMTSGKAPASEAETKWVIKAVEAAAPSIVIDIHGSDDTVYVPSAPRRPEEKLYNEKYGTLAAGKVSFEQRLKDQKALSRAAEFFAQSLPYRKRIVTPNESGHMGALEDDVFWMEGTNAFCFELDQEVLFALAAEKKINEQVFQAYELYLARMIVWSQKERLKVPPAAVAAGKAGSNQQPAIPAPRKEKITH